MNAHDLLAGAVPSFRPFRRGFDATACNGPAALMKIVVVTCKSGMMPYS